MPTYGLINEKLLEVKLSGESVYARKGSMIAYTGEVAFRGSLLAGGRVQDLAMRNVTGEGLHLMKAQGNGTVLYAHRGQHVTVISLTGETFYVESNHVLAFDERLRAGTIFLGNQGGVQGLVRGAMSGSGLFTTTLEGRGELALLSEGDAIGLEVSASRPIFVDPQAYLGHRGGLTSTIHTDVSWKTLVGQGSGESFQLKFVGSGTVYIQASEG